VSSVGLNIPVQFAGIEGLDGQAAEVLRVARDDCLSPGQASSLLNNSVSEIWRLPAVKNPAASCGALKGKNLKG